MDYNYIGLNEAVWTNACAAVADFYTMDTQTSPVICDSVVGVPYAPGSCNQYSGNFNFTMQFLDTNMSLMYYTLGGWSLQQSGTINSSPVCIWTLQNIGEQNNVVVGLPFFRQFYTVFDSDNS
jgi:hypothetical protein